MKKNVFNYVVLLHPSKDEEDEKDTVILKQRMFHLAKDKAAAEIDALRDLPKEVKSDQVEVIVRPFSESASMSWWGYHPYDSYTITTGTTATTSNTITL